MSEPVKIERKKEKHLLLGNHLTNQRQILCGASLGRGNESLFVASGSHDQDGRHGPRGPEFEPHDRCVVSLRKALSPSQSTNNTQEEVAPSQHD